MCVALGPTGTASGSQAWVLFYTFLAYCIVLVFTPRLSRVYVFFLYSTGSLRSPVLYCICIACPQASEYFSRIRVNRKYFWYSYTVPGRIVKATRYWEVTVVAREKQRRCLHGLKHDNGDPAHKLA